MKQTDRSLSPLPQVDKNALNENVINGRLQPHIATYSLNKADIILRKTQMCIT